MIPSVDWEMARVVSASRVLLPPSFSQAAAPVVVLLFPSAAD
jgi:hypothetical protein